MPQLYVSDLSNGHEYCAFDTFSAECSDRDIILITHALYGAMKIGKCIEWGFGEYHRIK